MWEAFKVTSRMNVMMVMLTLHWREAYWQPLPHRGHQVQAPLRLQPPWKVDPEMVTVRAHNRRWIRWWFTCPGRLQGPRAKPMVPMLEVTWNQHLSISTFYSLILPPWLLTESLPKFSLALPLLLELFIGCFEPLQHVANIHERGWKGDESCKQTVHCPVARA